MVNERLVIAPAHLEARRRGWVWVVDCPFCGQLHHHGGGGTADDPRASLGPRVSHCISLPGREYLLVEGAPPSPHGLAVSDGVEVAA